ncbi:HNH endonuclease [Psychroserpens luteolus]|uniref:HNH endonuclease n=1 Tax=Psychroserpens luteolus TaxID=2855840 RepID=UPI001E5650E4|nr:hypothetical protein [Psychroserpens luteolus]MCD2258851.1 hypothetical protein [Psychroserpens luteolus]
MEKLSQLTSDDYKIILVFIIVILILIIKYCYKKYVWRRQWKARRDYYRDVYLKSEAWQRKRYVVLRRDNWECVHCDSKATQVHHTRYAKYNIGKETIEWLESVCKPCHNGLHS